MTVSLLSWSAPFLVLLLAGLVARFYLQQRAYQKESEKIRALQDKIKAALEDQATSFDASLHQSLARTRSAQPETTSRQTVHERAAKDAPEKYRILTNLAARGMTAEEIAAILGISTTEAGQLVTLSNMAGWNN